MATVADLARLENLVDRLTPLSGKRRGEMIEANDWNQLAGALLELARISLGESTSEAVATHEHPDQVDVGWLTPKLRALVTEGGLRDPAAEAELGRIDRQVRRVMESVESLVQRLDRLQADIKTVETRDITRQVDLTRFSRRLDGAFDAREDVAGLRSTLRALETDVRTAVELSRRLQDDTGQDIDFNDLAGRLRETEALREALTMPSGQLMDAAEYERRLEELRASLVTEDELDEALDGVRSGVETDLRDAVLEETRVIARSTLEQSLANIRGELTARIDERLAGLDDLIDSRITPATSDLREEILTTARNERIAELDSALEDLRESVAAEREERLEGFTRQIDARLEAQRTEITAGVDSTIADRIESATANLTGRLVEIESQMRSVEAATAANSQAVQENATGLAAARRDFAAADAQIRSDYIRRLNEMDAGLDARIDSRIGTLRTDLRTQLQADMDSMVRTLETRLNETIRRNVATEVTLSGNRLRNDVTAIVDTVVVGLRADLERSISERIVSSGTRVSGLVAEEVRRSLSGLDDRVRREVEAFRSTINRRSSDPSRPG